jgi:sulfonate transport system substrate-binding protein
VKGDQLGEQQKIADAFFAAGLLPKAVDAKDVEIWKP